MTATITPKYNIGDKFYFARTKTEQRRMDCPDCLGERQFKVLAPSGDEFTMDCPRCSGSTWLRDVPELTYRFHVADVVVDEVKGYCVNEYGEDGIKYRGSLLNVAEDAMITDEAVAQAQAEALAEELNAKAEAEPARIHHKFLAGLKLKEATVEQFKNGLYDSWGAFRHLREAVDEVIENEDGGFRSRDEIVTHLEGQLSTTHRYEFVFKGFTRAMEAVVALVHADDSAAPAILSALREQWKLLPEQAQTVWTPSDRIKTDWSGKPLPTF